MQIEETQQLIPEDEEEFVVEVAKEAQTQEDDPVAALKGELDKARKERDEASARFRDAEARRVHFENEARQHGTSEANSRKALIEHAIIAEQSRADLAESGYADAMREGNFTEAAKLQRVMAQSEAKLTQLNAGLDHMTRSIEERNTQPQPAAQQQDGVEGYISRFSQPSQEWLRKNREDIFSNESRGNMAYAGHIVAVNNGLTPDTDEYFAFLDRHMGYAASDDGQQKAVQQKKAVAHSAPPSRNQAITGSSTKVSLSAEERALAADFGMTNKEYAEYKAKIASGEMNVSFSKEGTY